MTGVQFLEAVHEEVVRATRLHGKFPTYHHAYGVIAEEFKEFEAEVFKRDCDTNKARAELIQLAAMCMRAVVDLEI